MATDRPILVLYTSAGAGHRIAADGLIESLRALAPDETFVQQDVLGWASGFFRKLYAGGYTTIVRRFPSLMGIMYRVLDQAPGAREERMRRWLQRWFAARMASAIERCRPKLVINTHFLPAEIVGDLRRQGRLDCPQVIVTTDFETHRMWCQLPTERFYTATEMGRHYLTTYGVPAAHVVVTGIPVRRGFQQPIPIETARRRLNLPLDQPIVLLLANASGAAPLATLVQELLAMPAAAHVVALAGRDERSRLRLEQAVRAFGRSVTVVGFTDEMHVWMRAADLAVSKPGGLTSSEALCCELPLVIMDPIPGQETANADFLLEQQAAIKINHPRLLGQRVATLLQQPERLDAMRAATRRLARPDAADAIAADALRLLGHNAHLTNAAVAKESSVGMVS